MSRIEEIKANGIVAYIGVQKIADGGERYAELLPIFKDTTIDDFEWMLDDWNAALFRMYGETGASFTRFYSIEEAVGE